MSTANPGGFETALGSVTLVLATCLFAVFLSNKHLYPLVQREPVLAVVSNAANTFIVSMWLIEQEHPELPLVERKITTEICFGLVFVGFFVRTWKLYIDAGLANERVKNKHGWFIRHRHYRSSKFLFRLTMCLVFIHLLLAILVAVSQPENNMRPAREAVKDGDDTIVTLLVVLCYFISFVVFSVLLAKTKEGFFIKLELRLVGIGSGLLQLIWFLKVAMDMPCSLPSCSVLILWVSWAWMMSCSIGIPLYVASKDPRFRWFRFLTALVPRKQNPVASITERMSSKDDRGSMNDDPDSASGHSSFASYHESQIDVLAVEVEPRLVRTLTPKRLARLKHVSLAKFLTYPAGRESFREFTVREFSVENMLFLEAVQRVNANPSPTKDDCKAVYEQYIAETGPNQVNLPAQYVLRLKTKLEAAELPETCKTVFTEATEHVVKLMQRDAYKRYQQTSEWHKHVVVFDVQKHAEQQASPSMATTDENVSEPSTPPLGPRTLGEGARPSERELVPLDGIPRESDSALPGLTIADSV